MPEHTSFLTYIAEWLGENTTAGQNIANLQKVVSRQPIGSHGIEPLISASLIVLLIVALAYATKSKITNHNKAVIPDDKLSLRTFMEILVGVFYNTAKDVMGPVRAKKYFPIIGTAGFLVLFSNVLGMIPGFIPPTSSWSMTIACALIVFVAFNYYGLKENGMGYLKHMAGPMPVLAPLIFPIEVLSLCVRPITLSFRLMLNMAVDHLLLGIVMGLVMWLVPIPIMLLGTLTVLVQSYVFVLLTTIYIALSTEHEEHGDHGHAGDEHHAH